MPSTPRVGKGAWGALIGKGMTMKKLVLGGVMAAGLFFAGAGSASAGEYTGNGGTANGGANASSVCAFSGQDMQDATAGGTEVNPPGFDDDALTWVNPGNGNTRTRGVQNYGQFVAHGMKDVLADERPGVACRGNAMGH